MILNRQKIKGGDAVMVAVKVKPLEHPIGQSADFELRDYRAELEHAIERSPESADREVLRRRLTEVLNEQTGRIAARKMPVDDSTWADDRSTVSPDEL